MISDVFILYTARSRIWHIQTWQSHWIFLRYYFWSESSTDEKVKNHPCFLGYEENHIRMKILSTAFLAIAITITLLTNKCSTKVHVDSIQSDWKWNSIERKKLHPLSKKTVLAPEYYYICVNVLRFKRFSFLGQIHYMETVSWLSLTFP